MSEDRIKTAKEIAEEKARNMGADPAPDAKDTGNKPADTDAEADGGRMPQLNFSTFVMMLSMTGMQQLGKLAHPVTGKVETDLFQAKQTIDLLEIIAEKTKGNLTKEEEDIIKSSLTNLRMNYADEVNRK